MNDWVDVQMVGGPNDGERWAVQGDVEGHVPQVWLVPEIDPVAATGFAEGATDPPQPIRTRVRTVPIRLTGDGWIADWYASTVEEDA